ncbi:MAG: DUF2288 family protein [Methylotenera sp.]|nr:DUF2288 family protein [Oligoflexia bacterium]
MTQSGDDSDTRKNLIATLDEAEWSLLMTHAQRDSLILVNPLLNLLEVAEKMARDDRPTVEKWIGSHQIAKPTADQLEAWNLEPKKRFLCVVVQPFVLVQEIAGDQAPASLLVH